MKNFVIYGILSILTGVERSPRDMTKVLDYGFEVSDFERQSPYYVRFRINTL